MWFILKRFRVTKGHKMIVRKRILPCRLIDWLCFILISVSMPLVFISEVVVILPAVHESGTFLHTFTFCVAVFLIFNIKGNFLACLLIDTSVDPNEQIPINAKRLGWHHCTKCQRLVPPRSWHCAICRLCILKRDHHCVFLGTCIGHQNHRYFILFTVYLFIGASYALVYNSWYLWFIKASTYRNGLAVLKMMCPLLMLVHGSPWHNMLLLYYNLNLLAFLYSAILLVYHVPIIMKCGVCFEKSKGYPYNTGSWSRNLEMIFGKRKHLVWLSPLLISDLPNNGTQWSLESENVANKNR